MSEPIPIIVQMGGSVGNTPVWLQPAAFAAYITGGVALLVLTVNMVMTYLLHKDKLKNDKELARDKFDFDVKLSRSKSRYDVSTEQWKTKTDFAESALADFYEARDRLAYIRMPMAFGHENDDRQGRDEEAPALRQARDIYYPHVRRLREATDFFNIFYSKRYRAHALFGPEGAAPYVRIWEALNRVSTAAGELMRPETHADNPHAYDHAERLRERVWEQLADDDHVLADINDAVRRAEEIFRPAIENMPALEAEA